MSIEAIYQEVRSKVAAFAPTPLVPAVAVVPWRTAASDTLEVFVVKRAPHLRFLAGTWCFPGGRLDSGDASPRQGACRELQEEAGIALDPASLVELAEFIAPEFATTRFHAVYFLAPIPSEQNCDISQSGGELTHGEWVSPKAALLRFERGEWLISTPVLRTLEALCKAPPSIDLAKFLARMKEAAIAESAANFNWPLSLAAEMVVLKTPTLPPAMHTNCYLVGRERVVIIDPGSPWPQEQHKLHEHVTNLRAQGRSVEAILLTHAHGDHTGGALPLAKAHDLPIWAHARAAEKLHGLVPIARELEGGDSIGLGSTSIDVVLTEGHAPGHLCFYEPETQCLVAGDMVATDSTILIDPSEGDMTRYIESLRRLAKLPIRLLLPAHGAPIAYSQEKLTGLIEHRLAREAKVFAALTKVQASIAALTASVYDDTPAFLHPLASRSLLSHLIKLESEGRARQVEESWQLS